MNKMRKRILPRGFTLIELVVIMLIIGVLAVAAVPRLEGNVELKGRGYADELKSAVRFAQRYAVASGCTVQISITGAGYALTTQDATCGIGNNVQGPSGSAFSGNIPSGVSMTGGTGSYSFDALGETGGGGSIQVQAAGSTFGFTITATSGFIQ